MSEYEHGVEQASANYKEVIRGHVAENARLRELVRDMWCHMVHSAWHEEPPRPADLEDRVRELGAGSMSARDFVTHRCEGFAQGQMPDTQAPLMADVVDVAEYILWRYGPMPTMKLHKLLYYTQAWHLVEHGEPMFEEDFEAWPSGPVIPGLFELHKGKLMVWHGDLYERRLEMALRKQSEGMQEVRDVIAANPDLPIMVLAENVLDNEYDWHYHDLLSASVEHILFPEEVKSLYGSYYGLDDEKWYDDELDVIDTILSHWFRDDGHGAEISPRDSMPTREWYETYFPIARMMAEDMPWHEYVIIHGE